MIKDVEFAVWLTDFKGKNETRFIPQITMSDEPCYMESRLHKEQGYPPEFYTIEQLYDLYLKENAARVPPED